MHKNIKMNRGLALPIALLTALILSLLAVSSMKQSNFAEIISGNVQDKKLSFEAAETILRHVEKQINSDSFSTAKKGHYFFGNVNIKEVNWKNDNQVIKYNGFSQLSAPLNRMEGSYIIEKMPFSKRVGMSLSSDNKKTGVDIYRITVYAQGIARKSSVIIQATYKSY